MKLLKYLPFLLMEVKVGNALVGFFSYDFVQMSEEI